MTARKSTTTKLNKATKTVKATKAPKREAVFSYEAPEARSVLLAGDFTGWNQSPVTLKRQRSGVWKATVSLEPGAYEYRFLVDGEWQDDPICEDRRTNAFGTSNCVRAIVS